MKTSSSPKMVEKKPNSKLSLQRKTKTNKAERKEKVQSVASAGLIDLNETCEFKDGKSMRGSCRKLTGSSVKGSIGEVGIMKGNNSQLYTTPQPIRTRLDIKRLCLGPHFFPTIHF